MKMEYKKVALSENVEEMFIGPFGSSLKNECFVDKERAYCMVYEQKHAIQKTMNVETRYVDEKKYKELKRFNVKGGDIIVSCRGTIGETFVVPEDAPLGIMHPSIMKIRLKDGVYDKYYFNSLLKMRLKKHKAEANGSGIKMAISATELGKEFFPVPSLEEQEQIKQVLLGLETLINTRKEELRLLDELIKARFIEMFGDPNIEFRYETYKFKEFASDMTKGPFGSDMKKDLFVQKGEDTYKVYIQANAIQGDQNIGDYYISKEYFNNKICRFEVHPGDYIITCDGTLGKHLKLNDEMEKGVISPSLLRLTLNEEKMTSEYFEYLWDMYMLLLMKKEARNACLVHLPSAKVIGEIDIPVPPFTLQEDFSRFVQQTDKSKVVVQKALEEAQLLFDSLMQKYFG